MVYRPFPNATAFRIVYEQRLIFAALGFNFEENRAAVVDVRGRENITATEIIATTVKSTPNRARVYPITPAASVKKVSKVGIE